MGRRAGDDFQIPRVLKAAERRHKVALPTFQVVTAAGAQAFEVEVGVFLQAALAGGADDLLFGQREGAVEVAQVAFAQALVAQHNGGVSVSVRAKGTFSPANRSNDAKSGRYVSVIASKNQSSSRNSAYSG